MKEELSVYDMAAAEVEVGMSTCSDLTRMAWSVRCCEGAEPVANLIVVVRDLQLSLVLLLRDRTT